MWAHTAPLSPSLLPSLSSLISFFSQSHHGVAPPPLSLALLSFSLLGRLLPPPPSPPLPLGYIGLDWIGKGAPGEFEPVQTPSFSPLPTRFPPPPTPPSRIKCSEICACDAFARRSLLPLSFGPGSVWCRISLVVQDSRRTSISLLCVSCRLQ